jgi:putative transposase
MKAYLFIHIIWPVNKQEKLLSKPVRTVLFAHIKKDAAERGIKILIINGVEDHVHCLLQLHPAQNLSQVTRAIKGESAGWINENKLLPINFEWEEEYSAYSVSPSGLQQVIDYIDKQELHHKTKTLAGELELFDKIHVPD